MADVAVIGAGVAGLAAACRLADAGFEVVVVDQAPRPGGRASAFTDRATGERVDNGQHVLFGCYEETYTFLRLIGAEALAPLQSRLELPMAGVDGRIVHLRCPNLPPPWHLLAGVLRWPALPWSDRLAALRVGRAITDARRDGIDALIEAIDPAWTVDDWLDSLRQPVTIRRWLWHPLAVAALNQTADVAAAAPFVRVLVGLFAPSRLAASIGMASVPLDEMYAEPARRFIEARGGRIHLRTPATVDVEAGRVAGISTPAFRESARAVISSVPWHAFRSIWSETIPAALEEVAAAASVTTSSPIVTVNLWFDGPVMDEPFIGMVDAPIHWIFNKAAIVGERLTHLAVVTSAADDLTASSNDTTTATTVEHLKRVLPRVARRQLVRSVVVREQRATFSVAPGGPPRPGAETGLRGFFLAGDWTDTGLPATIEGAAISGHTAADLAARFLGRS